MDPMLLYSLLLILGFIFTTIFVLRLISMCSIRKLVSREYKSVFRFWSWILSDQCLHASANKLIMGKGTGPPFAPYPSYQGWMPYPI